MPDDVLEKSGAKAARAAFAQVPLAKPEQLADAHAILFGTPTRFGNVRPDAQLSRPDRRAVDEWRIQRDTPGYGPRRTAEQLRGDLAAAKRYADQ